MSPKGLNLKYEDIYFEPTKEAKLDNINNSGCSYFIDDLPDILKYVDKKINRVLYLNNQSKPKGDNWEFILDDWIHLCEIINAK